MSWYFLVIVICLVLNFVIWYAFSRWYLKDDFVIIIGDNMKRFMKTMLLAVVIATLLCSVKLFKMSSCATKGFITNASTQYSWVMDQCQAKNATGVYVDIERTRGTPGEDHGIVDDTAN
ncbi:putative membrane protein [Erwinia phage pEa_SNUABM_50]|uniref:Uncharacterized protein n=4 Tax=Eneladusvirus BF TaxID=2560751 RepID=A0A1S6UAY0_9CAUD|nr:hypothetical protein FDH34_gp346 [Serratia phage BF]QOI71283.1 putative membrane protein [Erwinia phage pEa_SNUABM_12]QOI71827.1 putative membrane protein [Erwinia phage pEa_SNUABM_47]QOI72366.1 putative membrane protein [Erwinia phage pEa_SNUABM_50]QXO11492.1 hypothetical protein pEaSNUABM19_00346 [Erwinia phage pEa_SNUABM_19]QXO12040.1 hypothetical protein pEaSNUABM44_00344 [Erwinia phage pEa_SNUABM_44]QXO12593.1 hypothetical protein pEaSNUABM49_00347 [Erwinia phage pEa_SNUABM_49]